MMMTHYMELLGQSAFHLIFLMVFPMMLAELLVTTEIFSLLNRDNPNSKWHTAKRHTGRLLAVYYVGMVGYLLLVVMPSIQAWRGWLDQSAVLFLIYALFPLLGILLLSFKGIGKNLSPEKRNQLHAILLVIYLMIGHFAMIFGMANPAWSGYQADHSHMNMNHMEQHMNH